MPALVDRLAAGAATEDIIARAHGLASAVLDADELVDLELIATGAASPLTGFAGRADYHAILATGQLADGTPWPVPFTLAVADVAVRPREALALRDHAGRLWGVLNVTDVFARDTERELAALYGTRDPAHPGVASMLARPTTLVGGMVDVLPLPADRPAARDRLTPRELRAVIAERGWRSVAGDSARDPLRRADEQVTKIGLELCDGLVLLVRLDPAQPPAVQLHALRALVAAYYPADRVVVALRPGARRHAGAAEARLDALIDANYGITFALTALAPAFYCAGCGAVASRASCPHEVSRRIGLSDDRVRALLVAGDAVPPEVMRPEVAEILRAHHQATVRVSGTPPASAASAARAAGFILWFTGMSGAGKSTLARAVAAQLGGERALEILDGDEVRTHLSAGLGFSREDRDTNVHRIGFVARTLAGHGVGVVTAAISPYRDTRAAVRAAAEAKGIPFVEVFANAPLEALVGRDVKGLYKQALAGELAHFTGVSDPYEPPTAPDIEVHTDRESVADSVATIIAALRTRGVLAPCATEVASP